MTVTTDESEETSVSPDSVLGWLYSHWLKIAQ